ncbi:hypothetical protein FRB90_002085 [Tulasnella sp. 427]|nr:hypothetical protein FRB90_002085 [Tulasnella sp. 427]
MSAGTSSRKRVIMDSDEEDVPAPQAGPSTAKRPRHSPSIEEPELQPPSTAKGKGKEKAPPPQSSSSRSRPPSTSTGPADSRAHRRRKTSRTVVTVTPTATTSNGESPADSVPTLVSSDHEEDKLPGPSTTRDETDEKPPPANAAAPSDDLDELARLRRELASKDALIQKHQDAFSSLQTALQCQICLEIMWDPYITSCGHTSCLSCLQSWFKSPPPDHNPNDPQPLAPHLRRKTCPTCRAPIRTRPTPVFIVKSVIGIAKPFFEDSALASENEVRPVPIVPGANGAGRQQPPDPWAGIFPAPRRPGEGGRHRHHDEDVDGVIEDEADGVLRIFNDLADDGGLTDDDEDDDADPPYPYFNAEDYFPWFGEAEPWHEDDEDVESDGGSYVPGEENEMHGFIVSDEDVDGESDSEEDDEPRGSSPHGHEDPHRQSDDDESGLESYPSGWGIRTRTRHLRDRGHQDSEDERRLRSEQARERERFMFGDGEFLERDQPQVAGPSRTRGRNRIQSDDEEDEPALPRARRARLFIESDDEEEPGELNHGHPDHDAGDFNADGEGERGWIGDQELYEDDEGEGEEEQDVERYYIPDYLDADDVGRDEEEEDDYPEDDYPEDDYGHGYHDGHHTWGDDGGDWGY